MGPEMTELLLRETERIARAYSNDPSSKFGAVVTDPEGRVISTGFNGFPPGIEEDERMDDRAVKYEFAIHAEMRAILEAARNLSGCVLFVNGPPCCRCAVHIIEAGITKVVCREPTADYRSRWEESFQRTIGLFVEAGVELSLVGGNDGK